jgi:two-component sensor histidine kinase
LVTGESGLRFYAGQLLKSPDGLPIGTLCVLDVQPRSLSPVQRRALQVLGRQVMSQIELRRSIARQDDVAKHRQLVQQETNHRLKNTMTMVQAIATQTLRRETSPEALAGFQARLQSLALAQDVLVREDWNAAQLDAVLREVVANAGQGDRFILTGPRVALGARAAFSASLITHELTTNAIKYGALSVSGGTVEVSWTLSTEALELVWKESGGPTVVEPSRKGFGSKLINMGLIGSGRVELRYLPTGFQAVLTASLQDLRLS